MTPKPIKPNKLLFVYRLRDTDSFQWLKEKNFEKVLGEDEAARFKRDFASLLELVGRQIKGGGFNFLK